MSFASPCSTIVVRLVQCQLSWHRSAIMTRIGMLSTWAAAAAQESMRLRPVVAGGMLRVVARDVRLSNGLVLPRGATITGSNLAVLNNPHSWDAPERFMPVRTHARPLFAVSAIVECGSVWPEVDVRKRSKARCNFTICTVQFEGSAVRLTGRTALTMHYCLLSMLSSVSQGSLSGTSGCLCCCKPVHVPDASTQYFFVL